jgi:hypothetical protein
MSSILSITLALVCAYLWGPKWLRAVKRRRGVQPGNDLDPVVTWGLRALPWLGVSTFIAAFVAPLRLMLGWPHWVWTVSNLATGVGTVLLFVLVSVVGFRLAIEEHELSGSDRASRCN